MQRLPASVRLPPAPALSPDEKQYRHLNTKADICDSLARGYRAQGDFELADANQREAARLRAEAKDVIRPFVERETEAAKHKGRASPIAARLIAYSR
jgi:hypothetical protein